MKNFVKLMLAIFVIGLTGFIYEAMGIYLFDTILEISTSTVVDVMIMVVFNGIGVSTGALMVCGYRAVKNVLNKDNKD